MGDLVADANRANEARWKWENDQGGFRDENVLAYVTDNRRLMDCYLMVFITGLLGKVFQKRTQLSPALEP